MRIGPFVMNWAPRAEQRNLEDPNHAITYEEVYGTSGPAVAVNSTTAMKISTVLGCVRVLAETIASVSWIVYERLPEGGKRRATEHHLYPVLHVRANPLMSSYSFRERAVKDVLLTGNFYALIDYDRYGYIRALWPLDPTRVRKEIADSGRAARYVITTSAGFDGTYRDEEIFHLHLLGDGFTGKSVITYNAESFGLALDLDGYARTFFSNGGHPGGVLEAEKGTLSPEARKRLQDGWHSAYGKEGGNWHRVAVLQDGVKWKPMTVSPKDAMALESRQFQVADITRMFRVPPHLVGDLSKATFSNIEHQSLEFVVHTIRPWAVRIEQETNWILFGPNERERFFSEFLLDSILRGDIKSRNEAYAIMRQNGALNADEWRDRENLNPIPGAAGEKYLVQLNMQDLSMVGKEQKG